MHCVRLAAGPVVCGSSRKLPLLSLCSRKLMLMSAAWMLISAECAFVVLNYSQLQIVFKSVAQRTDAERERMARGLLRGLVVEAVLFVPASATLLFLLVPILPWVAVSWADTTPRNISRLAALGMVSYPLPLVAIRRMVVRMALKSLRAFIAIESRTMQHELNIDNVAGRPDP